MPIQKSSRLPTSLSHGSVRRATAKSVSSTRSTIAAAEPQMIACFCCLRGSERAARAITTALSPERMTLTPMIFARPIQKACETSSSSMRRGIVHGAREWPGPQNAIAGRALLLVRRGWGAAGEREQHEEADHVRERNVPAVFQPQAD